MEAKMIIQKRFVKILVVTGIAAMLILPFAAIDKTAFAWSVESKTVSAGSTWVVGKTTNLSGLTIAEGAVVKAPEGKSLTMTVDGIGTAIKPGVYKGDIFITVTDSFIGPGSGMQKNSKQVLRAAILIEDGKYVQGKSVPAIVEGGKVNDKAATGVTLTGTEDDFNGIIVTGNSEYTIEGLKIDFEGDGDNDFIGYGSGIACFGNSKVTVNNSEIKFKGVTRTTVHCGGNSVVTLNNCNLSNESPVSQTKGAPTWALGFRGTNRVTQLCDNSTVYYNNCRIKGNGWGVLSIDGGVRVRMYVKDSTVELSGPRANGYGAFSIGDALVSYDNCKINVQGYPLLMGGGEGINNGVITNGTVITSTRYGVVIFRDAGSELKVNKGAVFNTASSSFVVKGSNSRLDIDNAILNPGNGIVLQLMDNDDPGMGPSRFIVPIGADTPMPGRDLTVANPKEDVFMTVSNMEVKGDFYNSTTNLKANCIEKVPMSPLAGMSADSVPEGIADTEARQGVKNLDLKFANSRVNGVISAATAVYKEGVVIIDAVNNKELNAVTQTAHEPVNNGVIVSLDKNSVWTVTGTSYLTSLTVAKGAVIKAPEGKTLTMTVGGVKTKIAAGAYTGKITLKVD
jgi:hypothetical protein